jgi:hypothetical protein
MASDAPENGYGAVTPAGDNLCNDFVRDLAHSYRVYAEHGGHEAMVDDEVGVALADNASPSLFLNPAVLLRPLTADSAEPFAACCASFYGARDGGPIAVWSMWPTPDLRPFGFELAGHPPFMVREPVPARPTPPDGLRVRAVTDDETARAYEVALIDGFPVHELQPPQPGSFFAGDARNAPGFQHFVGFVDDVPVATATAYTGERVVRVDNVSTLPDARGKGYGAALTWAATLVRPDLPATLFASDPGRPIYERMGYRAIFRATFWIGPRTRHVP